MLVKRKKENQEGFTLLELLVVIALMGIITGITLSNYSGMNKSVELQNTVYNVALSIRESQVYGINKKLDSAEFSDEDPYPFGMHIDTTNIDKIIIFKDRDGNPDNQFLGASDCSITTPKECEKIIKLNKGNHISKIRVKSLGGGWDDYDGKINIIFTRPNPDAVIIDNDNSSNIYSRIGVEVSSKDDIYSGCVEIGSAGDISLKKDCN